jgi:flagellar motor protein MotB
MKGQKTDGDFSHSLTDLMSGLAVMFLLIAAIFMLQSARATKEAQALAQKQTQLAQERQLDADELDKLKQQNSRSRDRLLKLRDKLEANQRLSDKIIVIHDPKDPLLLTISFTNDKLGFAPLACEVDTAQKEDLRATLSFLFSELCETIQLEEDTTVTQTIALEGHTDSAAPREARCGMTVNPSCFGSKSPECQREAFENNVRLSARRAQFVFFQARDVLRGNTKVAKCLDDYFVVAGRGPVSPVQGEGPYSPKNRRVEIKVRVIATAATDKAASQ